MLTRPIREWGDDVQGGGSSNELKFISVGWDMNLLEDCLDTATPDIFETELLN